MSLHCLALVPMDDRQGVPHIIFIICIMWQRNEKNPSMEKHFENQKLAEQMITGI